MTAGGICRQDGIGMRRRYGAALIMSFITVCSHFDYKFCFRRFAICLTVCEKRKRWKEIIVNGDKFKSGHD